MVSLVLLGFLVALPAAPSRPVHLAITPAASQTWLDRLNQWRGSTGLPPVTENTTWSQGDYAHSQYMVMNDLVTHYETPGTPYYSTAGDTAAQDGNIFVSSSTATTDAQAIDWWMGAPFHSMGLMDPRLTTSGFGSYRNSGTSPWQMGATVDVLRGLSAAGTYPTVFPGNGTTEPLTSFSGNEFPDPLGPCGYSAPAGLPVWIELGANLATTVGSVHTLTGNGVALNNCVLDSNNASVGSYLKSRGGVVMVPQKPLVSGTRYVVALTVNGTPYTWSFTVGPFSACASVDAGASPTSPAPVGTSVAVTATAGGCPNPSPLYEFWVLAPGASLYTLAQAYSTSATFDWNTTGLAEGTYRINVWARDALSNGTYGNTYGRWDTYNANLTFNLGGCQSVSESASPSGGVMPGTAVTFTASATGCANPTYEFWLLAPGASLYTLAQAYSASPTFAWNTAGLATGTYRVNVWARDAASPGAYGNSYGTWDTYDANLTYVLKGACAAVTDAPSPLGGAMAGLPVTFTAAAAGCTSPLYEFWVKAPGATLYTLAQAYSTTATLSWTTAGKATGAYAVTVWVRDSSSAGTHSNSSGAWDAYSYLSYALTAGCPSVTDTPAPLSSTKIGTAVVFTAAAPGCSSPLYEFWIKSPGATLYTLARAYSSTPTFTWGTAGNGAGTYTVTVWVRDSTSGGTSGNSSGRWDAYTYRSFTLTP